MSQLIVVLLVVSLTQVEDPGADREWRGSKVGATPIVAPLGGEWGGTNAACGVYSLLAALHAAGRTDVQLADVLQAKYISGARGSTLADLQVCATDLKVRSRALIRMSVTDLSVMSNPILLHVRSRPWVDGFDHWICVLGTSADGVLVYDALAEDAVKLTWDELSSRWSGAALEVVGPTDSMVPFALMPSTMFAVASVLTIVAILAAARAWLDLEHRRTLSALCLLAVGSLSGIALASGMRGGLLNTAEATRDIDLWHTEALVRYIGPSELRRLMANDAVQVVDARQPSQFSEDHIIGSLNLSADRVEASVTDRVSAGLRSDVPIVVYCSTDECNAAARVAQRLSWEGMRDVRVLRGGLAKWNEQ